MANNAVEHPEYYGGKDNPYEALKVIQAWDSNFCIGNILKYLLRAGKKEKTKEIEDLKKARFYLDAHIAHLESKQ
jgi:hypothetical protein